MTLPLLAIDGLVKSYRRSDARVRALDGLSLAIGAGETLGLVGASGCGKSTLARVVARLTAPDAGSIDFRGGDWLALDGAPLRRARRHLQMVFQDPLAAFNPRATVAGVLADPLRVHAIVPRDEIARETGTLLERVGLPPAYAGRSILALSGGERQRVAIARAIAPRPELIILDEAVSALDVGHRKRILELIVDLQRERGVAYLFIGHDLAVVRAVSHRIAVMDAGRVVEEGPATAVIAAPKSAAARSLVEAVPRLNPGDPS
jgi:peptide/nickel transport system ATP-binding protein